jgi:subtilisin-like proprotein convertase family protein
MTYFMKAIWVSAASIAAMASATTAGAAVIVSQGSGFAIDNDATQRSVIRIADTSTITNVTFSLNGFQHSYLADLSATLTHNGVEVRWLDLRGLGVGVDGDYRISDAGPTTLDEGPDDPVVSGTYHAFDLLSGLNGMSAAGDWTLTISDTSPFDEGRLDSWTLNLITTATTPTPAIPEPATWAMMTLGMGAVGMAMRRRRTRVSYTA